MSKFWDDDAVEVASFWDDDAVPVKETPDVSQTESGLRGAAQGLSFGFADEMTGGVEALWEAAKGDPATFGELYRRARDESREAYRQAEEANPKTYMAGQVAGAIAPALATAGTGALATGGRLLGGAATGVSALAAQGAAQGLGSSEADLTQGDYLGAARDTAIGAATGAAIPVAGKLASWGGQKLVSGGKKILPKIGSIITKVDEDALIRQMQRPAQTAAAESEGFVHELGKKGIREIDALGDELGSKVAGARDELIGTSGNRSAKGLVDDLTSDASRFLERNAPSKSGFSAITQNQREEIEGILSTLKDGNIEDLVKAREYLDNVERLAKKYGSDNLTTYDRQIMKMRGQIDQILDTHFPKFDEANRGFSQFASDKSAVGLHSENRAESILDNLYGKNKTARQEAAERILQPDTMESIKDVASNKAFGAAQGGAGSKFGVRNAVGIISGGALGTVAGEDAPFGGSAGAIAGLALSQPRAWQHIMRGSGTISNNLDTIVKSAPEMLGKFAKPLQAALARGGNSLAATHYVLQQTNPEYRDLVNKSQGGSDEEDR